MQAKFVVVHVVIDSEPHTATIPETWHKDDEIIRIMAMV